MPGTKPSPDNLVELFLFGEGAGNDAYGCVNRDPVEREQNKLVELTSPTPRGTGPNGVDASIEGDGSTNYFLRDDDPSHINNAWSFNSRGADQTIVFWVKIHAAASGTHGLAQKFTSGTGVPYQWFILFRGTNDDIRLGVKDLSDTSYFANANPTGTIARDTWHMVTIRWDESAKVAQIILNDFDANASTSALPDVPTDSGGTFEIGRYSANKVDGEIAHLQSWDTYLTDDNIEWLYNEGSARLEAEYKTHITRDIPAHNNLGKVKPYLSGELASLMCSVHDSIGIPGNTARMSDARAKQWSPSHWQGFMDCPNNGGIIRGENIQSTVASPSVHENINGSNIPATRVAYQFISNTGPQIATIANLIREVKFGWNGSTSNITIQTSGSRDSIFRQFVNAADYSNSNYGVKTLFDYPVHSRTQILHTAETEYLTGDGLTFRMWNTSSTVGTEVVCSFTDGTFLYDPGTNRWGWTPTYSLGAAPDGVNQCESLLMVRSTGESTAQAHLDAFAEDNADDFMVIGNIFMWNDTPGLNYLSIGDSSFNINGHGADDTADGATFPKKYNLQQLVDYLRGFDVVAKMGARPVIIMDCATESTTETTSDYDGYYAYAKKYFQEIRTLWVAACNALGWRTPLFWWKPCWRTNLSLEVDEGWAQAAYEMSTEYGDAYLSVCIYNDGILWDGNGGHLALNWANDAGYGSFFVDGTELNMTDDETGQGFLDYTNCNWLDATPLHQRDVASAQVFADMEEDVVLAQTAIYPTKEDFFGLPRMTGRVVGSRAFPSRYR